MDSQHTTCVRAVLPHLFKWIFMLGIRGYTTCFCLPVVKSPLTYKCNCFIVTLDAVRVFFFYMGENYLKTCLIWQFCDIIYSFGTLYCATQTSVIWKLVTFICLHWVWDIWEGVGVTLGIYQDQLQWSFFKLPQYVNHRGRPSVRCLFL